MTFASIPIGEEFKDLDGIIYTKLSETTAQGPKWRWRKSSLFEFAADDPVEEFCRWQMP